MSCKYSLTLRKTLASAHHTSTSSYILNLSYVLPSYLIYLQVTYLLINNLIKKFTYWFRRVSLLLIYRSTLVKVCRHKFSNLLIKKYHTFLGFYCFPTALLFALFCFILFLYHIVFFLWNLLLNKLEFALDLHYWCCYLRIPDFLSLIPLCFALCPFWFLLIH